MKAHRIPPTANQPTLARIMKTPSSSLLSLFVTLLLSTSLMAEKPVADDGSIHLEPGDSFMVQFDRSGDKLVNPRVVEEMTDGIYVLFQVASTFGEKPVAPAKPNSLLTFMMGESPDHTILLIQKHMDGRLDYDCQVRPEGKQGMEDRNNLPLEEKFPMLEQYPEKLDAIVLKNFTTG